MKRVIKFRAWSAHERKMYQDALYVADNEDDINPWIYMQFTGLKDKNGKDLYESDIVSYIDDSMEPVTGEIDTPHEVVSMEIGINGSAFLEFLSWNEFEIIGNIYENPNLLT